ncbi:MAG: ATP-binding protein [Notoacmeibacter sp.]|nr:ATP-binding protein [Notoacmeibacter sp.]MCC0031926.1 ATP-binding protein [Brucellaceae bacterium]
MDAISKDDILIRVRRDNPWWSDVDNVIPEAESPRRVYFNSFVEVALNKNIRRAAILLGPRRVGKTFMLKQLIHEAMLRGQDPKRILYISVDTPIYLGIRLEAFIEMIDEYSDNMEYIVIFDEIQYLSGWEVHLKDLVDSYKNIKFIASGSAAAALRLKSKESGAGRFSDFMLPPLTFYEFLLFIGRDEELVEEVCHENQYETEKLDRYKCKNIEELNNCFIDYLNFGGYPEAVLNQEIRKNPERFIKNDIIDKVLLKDLPSLYGINRIQELNQLFSFLAYNAGLEASYENISQETGLTKPMVKQFIEYLESAFLIIKTSSTDEMCRIKQRERNFKVYLNNPSMRAALFAPVVADDSAMVGRLAESAIFSQWQHSARFGRLHYARWRNGEVDIVYILSNKNAAWIGEIKWSDQIKQKFREKTSGIAHLIRKNPSIESSFITTKTIHSSSVIEGCSLRIYPSALYAYMVGRNITKDLDEVLKRD